MTDGRTNPSQDDGADFAAAEFFAFRTPLLPFDELLAFGDGLAAAKADPTQRDAALAADRAVLRARLRAIVARREVREALFVASPSLYERIGEWLERPDEKRGQKVERALVRYFERLTARATPFGLFAGCSIGAIATSTHLELAPRASYRRHTRLDMDYLFALSEELSRDPALRPALRFRPNSSLYRAGGRIRYAQARLEGKARSYHLVAVDPSDSFLATLDRAADGARPSELAAALVDEDVSAGDAEAYVGELIDNQILVSELAPAVTGCEPIHALVAPLRAQPAAGQVVQRLDAAQATIEALDRAGLGIDPERYVTIARLLEDLPAAVELPRLFQVDMSKPVTDARLGGAVLDEIVRGVSLLHRTSSRVDDVMQRFAEEFVRRYGDGEVPLVEALDDECGVGFDRRSMETASASPLLAGIAFPLAGSDEKLPWTARQRFLLRKLEQAWRSGAAEIDLGEGDWKALEQQRPVPPLPDSFAVTAVVRASSHEALAAGEFRVYVQSAVGPSSARMLGRFCHGDPALTEHLLRHVRAEEALDPEAVFAEIVHLPQGRVGNVLLRPILRDHEIPFLGRAAVPADKQIPIDDLLVSVGGGSSIVLRSARLGRRVVPRLSAAHSFRGPENLSLYGFLGSLQGWSSSGMLTWSWAPFDDAPFLPRLTSGRLILSLARWQLGPERLHELGAAASGAERFRRAQAMREELALPRFVAVEEFDNALPIDFENVLSIETFAELVKNRPGATLVELPAPPEGLCARGPEGRFAHELVVPMLRRRAPTAAVAAPLRRTTTTRRFAPGSEWLYGKLYAGTSSVDRILAGAVAEVVRRYGGAFDRWFFVRYADPDWHLRLRFHGVPDRLHHELLPALQVAASSLLDDGLCWRLQLDTYEREVERYGGGEGICLSERVFQIDSEAALGIVELLAGDEGADARWRLTLRGMDALLDDLKLDLGARRRVVGTARSALAGEFRFTGAVEHQLGARFRKYKLELESLLDPSPDEVGHLAAGIDLLRRRSEQMRPVVAELEQAERAGRLTCTIEALASSYLHMHANRLLRSAHRAQELLIYDFLDRIYQSRAARCQASS
jgi:lantibiotic biosynthesis protein